MTQPPIPVPGLPCDAEGPVFREPWEAQAFAMTLTLHQRPPALRRSSPTFTGCPPNACRMASRMWLSCPAITR